MGFTPNISHNIVGLKTSIQFRRILFDSRRLVPVKFISEFETQPINQLKNFSRSTAQRADHNSILLKK